MYLILFILWIDMHRLKLVGWTYMFLTFLWTNIILFSGLYLLFIKYIFPYIIKFWGLLYPNIKSFCKDYLEEAGLLGLIYYIYIYINIRLQIFMHIVLGEDKNIKSFNIKIKSYPWYNYKNTYVLSHLNSIIYSYFYILIIIITYLLLRKLNLVITATLIIFFIILFIFLHIIIFILSLNRLKGNNIQVMLELTKNYWFTLIYWVIILELIIVNDTRMLTKWYFLEIFFNLDNFFLRTFPNYFNIDIIDSIYIYIMDYFWYYSIVIDNILCLLNYKNENYQLYDPILDINYDILLWIL